MTKSTIKKGKLNSLIDIIQKRGSNEKKRENEIAIFLKNVPRVPHDGMIQDEMNFPSKIVFDVNSACNLQCKMCYVKGRNKTQVPYGVFVNTLKEIKKNNARAILSYSSLEPFLRNDFLKIIKKTHELGIPFSIFTNGTLIDKKIANLLVKYNPISITFSLHGLKDTHEMINGVKGSYDKVINAIENINYYKKTRKKKLPFIRVNCVISALNYRELPEFVSVGKKLKLNMRFSHLIWEDEKTHNEILNFIKKNLKTNNKDIRIDFSNQLSEEVDVKDLIKIIKTIKKDKNIQFLPNLNNKDLIKWYTSPVFFKEKRCFYPFESINIRSNGDVHPCAFIDFSYGNIFDKNIEEIWKSDKALFFKNLLKKKGVLPPCNKCCKL
jgi:MoaA/NifB/PqqE/SkfB family radical SAM enzyme